MKSAVLGWPFSDYTSADLSNLGFPTLLSAGTLLDCIRELQSRGPGAMKKVYAIRLHDSIPNDDQKVRKAIKRLFDGHCSI